MFCRAATAKLVSHITTMPAPPAPALQSIIRAFLRLLVWQGGTAGNLENGRAACDFPAFFCFLPLVFPELTGYLLQKNTVGGRGGL